MNKLLIAALIGGIMLMSNCDNEPEEANPFVGAWTAESGTQMVFAKETVTNYKPNGDIFWSGNYLFNETHITVTTNYRDSSIEDLTIYPNPFIWQYVFQDEKLITYSPAGNVWSKVVID